MKRAKPTHIGDIITQMKITTPLGLNLEQAMIWEKWEAIAGAHLAQHSRPHSIKKGQLRILVESPVWMHKLSYTKWELLRRVNRMAGKELVSDTFFVLADDEEALKALDE